MDIKESLKYLKLRESTISMILGVVVILVSGTLLINYFANRNENSSPTIEIGDEMASQERTHTVLEGESLGTIAQKYYGSSSNWVDLVRENNIEDADNIVAGQVLTIPEISVTPKIAVNQNSTPTIKTDVTEEVPTESPSPTSIPLSPSPTTEEQPSPTATETPSPSPSPTVVTENGQGAISTEARQHTIQEGETLWSIAEKYYNSGYNWVDIAENNKLANSNLIEEGRELFIPNVDSKTTTVAGAATEQSSDLAAIGGDTYQVQNGDNLWNIAVRAYGDGYKWTDISRENNLGHPNLIHPGNVLSLPR